MKDCGADVMAALRTATEIAKYERAGGAGVGETPMVVAGSLYLAGDVLRMLGRQ